MHNYVLAKSQWCNKTNLDMSVSVAHLVAMYSYNTLIFFIRWNGMDSPKTYLFTQCLDIRT